MVTVNWCRPLDRRALRTRRPSFVAMRLRNPWVRIRLRRLGCHVRFIFYYLSPD